MVTKSFLEKNHRSGPVPALIEVEFSVDFGDHYSLFGDDKENGSLKATRRENG